MPFEATGSSNYAAWFRCDVTRCFFCHCGVPGASPPTWASVPHRKASRLYFLKLLKRSGLSADDLLCFYKSVIHSVLEQAYGSVVWHHHLTHAQSDKLEALQKRAVRIILYSVILPYITAFGYLKLESLKHRRTVADKKFFNGISQSYKSLHHLLPPPRNTDY